MLDRAAIRSGKFYWVRKRKGEREPTIAFLSGELPSLSIRALDEPTYSTYSCCDYDFLGEAKMGELFEFTFHGLPLTDLLASPSFQSDTAKELAD